MRFLFDTKLLIPWLQVQVVDGSKSDVSPSNQSLVFISIGFFDSFSEIPLKSHRKCYSLIRIIIDCNQISDSSTKELKLWAQSQSHVCENFFAIHTNIEVKLFSSDDRWIKCLFNWGFGSSERPIDLNRCFPIASHSATNERKFDIRLISGLHSLYFSFD